MYWALVIAIGYIALKYVIVWLLPFIAGLAVAVLLNPMAQRLARKHRLRSRTASIV